MGRGLTASGGRIIDLHGGSAWFIDTLHSDITSSTLPKAGEARHSTEVIGNCALIGATWEELLMLLRKICRIWSCA